MRTKFLCDVMLARLARYLRAAGHDTVLASDAASDRDVLRQAIDENRCLLTADRKIVEHRAARGRVLTLPNSPLDAQVKELSRQIALSWTSLAFTRCLLDNTLLVSVNEQDLLAVPEDVIKSGDPIMQCPACRRIYWRGSHYRRMMGRLEHWQDSASVGSQ